MEKILAAHEGLRSDWPVDGTTGYEFTNLVLGVMIDSAGEAAITRQYVEFSGETKDFAEVVRECKLRIMRNEMASELNMLAHEAARVAHQHPSTADFTRHILHRAIREVVACFPVYRTYVDTSGPPSAEDLRDLNWAMTQARASDNDVDASAFDFVHKLLSGELVAVQPQRFQPPGRVALRHEVPAVQRPRDGQGTGRHGILPVPPLYSAQRSRRAARPIWSYFRGLSQSECLAPQTVA